MTQENTTAAERRDNAEPATFTKQVGGTTYQVNVHFSKTSKETLTDKILRLIRREVSGL
jgi:hypothetical protein